MLIASVRGRQTTVSAGGARLVGEHLRPGRRRGLRMPAVDVYRVQQRSDLGTNRVLARSWIVHMMGRRAAPFALNLPAEVHTIRLT